MKLWHSFVKELILSSRSFYFYIEILMAGILLFLLLFVIPETFNTKTDEYIYLDVPEARLEGADEEYLSLDSDGVAEIVEYELDGETIVATLYENETARRYIIDDEESMVALADRERDFGATIRMNEEGEVSFTYYMQGYETESLRNIYLVYHNGDYDTLKETIDAQDVRVLEDNHTVLSDKENVIPSLLVFNGSLMGLFMIASYVFLDKKEGVIKAYAVTASAVWQYLLSKAGVVAVTSTVASLVIVIPVMGLQANYPLMILFLLASGFFASALGLVLSSFYDNITQAFGVLYMLIIVMMLPNIAYFIPSWDPIWMRYIPTYPMLQSFKEVLLENSDVSYVLMTSLGFAVIGAVLFLFANIRFKQTLTI